MNDYGERIAADKHPDLLFEPQTLTEIELPGIIRKKEETMAGRVRIMRLSCLFVFKGKFMCSKVKQGVSETKRRE